MPKVAKFQSKLLLLPIASALLALSIPSAAFADPTGDAMADKLMSAIGDRETWASRKVDHITAVVKPDGADGFLTDVWTRWDKPQVMFWIRTRTREQLRVWDGVTGKGWTATRQFGGGPAEVKEWSAERVKSAEDDYKGQFERLIHRIAKRDQHLSFKVSGEGPFMGWLEAYSDGNLINRIMLRDDGSPKKVTTVTQSNDPIIFDVLVSFGDHKQPGSGNAGEHFTTYVAKLMPTADGLNFGPPKDLMDLDPQF